jgi:hypothetical protein
VTLAPKNTLELGDVTLTEIVGGGAGVATGPTAPVLHPSVDIAASSAVPNVCRQPWFLRPTVLARTSPMPAGESKRSASASDAFARARNRACVARARPKSRNKPQRFSELYRSTVARKRRPRQAIRIHTRAEIVPILILNRAHVPNWFSGISRSAAAQHPHQIDSRLRGSGRCPAWLVPKPRAA